MRVFRVRNHAEYTRHASRMQESFARYEAVENALPPATPGDFLVNGYSYAAGTCVDFSAGYQYGVGGRVNWREVLTCPITGLNNRMRASIHAVEMELGLYPDHAIYISEQVTPLYAFVASKWSGVVGSEHLGDATPLGEVEARGLRNEDLTRLTFPDASFDRLVSLDCFEHFADYKRALREAYRVLKPGASMLWSVPFDRDARRNDIRARERDDGSIEHFQEPEYHADPMSPAGCLVFNVFGWEMLDDVRACGFSDAYAMLFWSREFGYLGGEQILFVAFKT